MGSSPNLRLFHIWRIHTGIISFNLEFLEGDIYFRNIISCWCYHHRYLGKVLCSCTSHISLHGIGIQHSWILIRTVSWTSWENLFLFSVTTPWTAAHQAPLPSTISWCLFKFMSTELVVVLNHLILCHPLIFLPSIFPSIRIIFNELAFRIRWPKYRSFNFSTSPSNEYSRLTSFRIDWFDLLAGIYPIYTVH